MKTIIRESDRGEFSTTTGVAHIKQAHRIYESGTLIELELRERDGRSVLGVIDTALDPFKAMLGEGLLAFVVENRREWFAYQIDTVRRFDVDPLIPFAALSLTDKFPAIVEFTPAESTR